MRQKIPCLCENAFEVDVPEEINLDTNKEYLEEIQKGNFFIFDCPSCGKKHKPEFPLFIHWPSKNLELEVLPELQRGDFYRKKKEETKGSNSKEKLSSETIISYPEMADRLAVIQDGFEPAALEAIKYILQAKAEEQYPEDEIDIWYYSCSSKGGIFATEDFLEFHIHGIKANEVAVTKVPYSLYQKILHDYTTNPKKEMFSDLRVYNYLSVKNAMRHEALK